MSHKEQQILFLINLRCFTALVAYITIYIVLLFALYSCLQLNLVIGTCGADAERDENDDIE